MSFNPFRNYDSWLQRGADSGFSTYLEGCPVKCSECGDRVFAPDAEDLVGEGHCFEKDQDADNFGECYGRYQVEDDYDFDYDDPNIP